MIIKISFQINKVIYLWVIGCITACKEIEPISVKGC